MANRFGEVQSGIRPVPVAGRIFIVLGLLHSRVVFGIGKSFKNESIVLDFLKAS
jgi:hypothetical protein